MSNSEQDQSANSAQSDVEYTNDKNLHLSKGLDSAFLDSPAIRNKKDSHDLLIMLGLVAMLRDHSERLQRGQSTS